MKDNNNLTVNQKGTEAAKVAGSRYTRASTLIIVITKIKLFMCTLIHTLVLSNQLLWLYCHFVASVAMCGLVT